MSQVDLSEIWKAINDLQRMHYQQRNKIERQTDMIENIVRDLQDHNDKIDNLEKNASK